MSKLETLVLEAQKIIDKYPALGKQRVLGEQLRTSFSGQNTFPIEVPEFTKKSGQLSCCSIKKIIHSLDLILVLCPDNREHTVNLNYQRVSSRLKQEFARQYRHSAYER